MKDLENLQQAADVDDRDYHRNAPKADPQCLYGLIGDVARAGAEKTEANPYAIAANFIAYLSCAVGRCCYFEIGNTRHHTRQFVLHVGRSGRGRKGDATSLIFRLDEAVRKLNPYSVPQVHRGGLSSREGLAFLIHDGYKEGKKEVPPILDKRLFVAESEFANILHQNKRDGNTLSAALRDAWDGIDMKPATKTSRTWASNPHIGLIGAVTPSELMALIAARDLRNGFANRFLFIWAERMKLVERPEPTPPQVVDELASRILDVLQFCRAERWAERDWTRMELSEAAQARYSELYLGELNDFSMGDQLAALLERRAPMLLRLAMLFALTDLTTVIEARHLDAALAWIRYSVDSVRFVFASGAEEQVAEETQADVQKLVKYLERKTVATRTQLNVDCFSRHISGERLDRAIEEMLMCNPPRITVDIDRSGGGRAVRWYRLTTNKNAKKANDVAGQPKSVTSVEREGSEPCELGLGDSEQVRIVREVADEVEAQQTIDSSALSLSSHISGDTDEIVEEQL